MKRISERGVVIVLFATTIVVFFFAQNDTRKIEAQYLQPNNHTSALPLTEEGSY